ncbi:hypothetical protein JOF53_000621 [Crossiella equi]|uniref:Uncharacterized protein n=1 Tax=Crossiella equi TaxID=130796 RepID=A0ABS5A582_9PSEU|nr:hypothetical protein [Crossiella equi]MBP2471749.1 hypothetical protein [Crossiella equi]
MTDELLRPTIHTRAGDRNPWRLGSMAYVAFFGGVLAVTTIAYLNSGKLGVPARQRRLILVLGGAALAVELVVAGLLAGLVSTSVIRLVIRAIAVLGHLAQSRAQRTQDRVFQLRGGEHAPLWKPGFAAVLGCGIPEALLVAVVVLTA